MVWFFQRRAEQLRIETRYERESDQFVLTVYTEDGSPRVELFPTFVGFQQRLKSLEDQLHGEQWSSAGCATVSATDPRRR